MVDPHDPAGDLPVLDLSVPGLCHDRRRAAPPGYYWVRYGPDLLLVDRRTRRVVDVIYSAFY
ncbi:RcnB family protein [Novosphingobium sp. ST904]|uniref:RcnB family protein n=1 Tax=Novosphingobium sp. ST904 TaxID=1684385 RepID=UPI001E323E69|nr:RcnB family protein [Novosphingobium sp. ST904]